MKLKVNFHIPTKDFLNSEYVPLTVESTLDPDGPPLSDDPEYTVIMPDHMFKDLANTEPRFNTKNDINSVSPSGLFGRHVLSRRFRKTQTATSIKSLQNYFYELTDILLDKHCPEKATMKKKIFIRFIHKAHHTTNGLNIAYWGEKISQEFQYFTGYEVMTVKFGQSLLEEKKPKKQYITKIAYASKDSSLKHHDTGFQEKDDVHIPLAGYQQGTEDMDRNFVIIDWTEEREAFCQQINKTFKDVNKRLSDFLLNLDGLQMDRLIEAGGFKLLAAPQAQAAPKPYPAPITAGCILFHPPTSNRMVVTKVDEDNEGGDPTYYYTDDTEEPDYTKWFEHGCDFHKECLVTNP